MFYKNCLHWYLRQFNFWKIDAVKLILILRDITCAIFDTYHMHRLSSFRHEKKVFETFCYWRLVEKQDVCGTRHSSPAPLSVNLKIHPCIKIVFFKSKNSLIYQIKVIYRMSGTEIFFAVKEIRKFCWIVQLQHRIEWSWVY